MFDAASTTLIGLLRFVAFGVPIVLIASSMWGISGLILALPTLHVVSLLIVLVGFRRALSRFAAAAEVNEGGHAVA